MVQIVLCPLTLFFLVAMFARIILSYFPLTEGGPMAAIFSFTYTITEPILGPVRRMIPPMGMFDVSSMIVLFGVYIIRGVLGC